MRGSGTILPRLIGFLIIDGCLCAALERGGRSGFSYIASFCPVNCCEWRFNILWKWGLTRLPCLLLLPGRSLQGRGWAPSDSAGWWNPMEKHAELTPPPHPPPKKGHITQSYRCQLPSSSEVKNLEKHTLLLSCFFSCPRKSPKAKLQVTAETRLKKAQHTRRSQLCPRWVTVTGKVPQSPLLASLATAFCLHTFTSCLLAQNTNKKPWRAFSCCHRNSYYNLKRT